MMGSQALCRLAAIQTLILVLATSSCIALGGPSESATTKLRPAQPYLVYSPSKPTPKPSLPKANPESAYADRTPSPPVAGRSPSAANYAPSGFYKNAPVTQSVSLPKQTVAPAPEKAKAEAPATEATNEPSRALIPPALPSEGLIKEVRGFQPTLSNLQTGANSLSYNNHVSNIKIGNNERQDYNLVNQVINPVPNKNLRLLQRVPFTIDNQRYALENEVEPKNAYEPDYAGAYEEQAPVSYQPDVTQYFNPPAQQSPVLQGKACDLESHQHLPRGKSFKKQLNSKAKKSKPKPTQEQVELKEQLLDLVSKATGQPLESDDDVPLLKFNKDTGKYEAVHSDTSANIYKEKLLKALEVINPRKLPTKKLRQVLNDDLSLEDPDAKAYPGSVGPNAQGQGAQQSDYEDVPLQTLRPADHFGRNQYEASGSEPRASFHNPDEYASYYGETDAGAPGGEPGNYDVRAVLDDSLNRVGSLLNFRPEFLNQLLNSDDAELSPLESEFKRFILCKEDEQFCNQQSACVAGGAYQSYRDGAGGSNQQEPREESPALEAYADPSGAQYSQYYDENEPQYEQSVPSQQAPDELQQLPAGAEKSRRFSRTSSQNSYTYKHSSEGARNGAPLKPQEEHFSQQSSYVNTNNGPAANGAARAAQVTRTAPRYQAPLSGPSRAEYNGQGLVAPASSPSNAGASQPGYQSGGYLARQAAPQRAQAAAKAQPAAPKAFVQAPSFAQAPAQAPSFAQAPAQNQGLLKTLGAKPTQAATGKIDTQALGAAKGAPVFAGRRP